MYVPLPIPVGDRNYYLETVRAFASVPDPEVFGLHSNADITCAQDETFKMFDTILLLMPRQAAGAGKKSRFGEGVKYYFVEHIFYTYYIMVPYCPSYI